MSTGKSVTVAESGAGNHPLRGSCSGVAVPYREHRMSIRVMLALVALAGIAVGCTATGDTPVPPTNAATTTSSFTPGSVVTTTSSTTVAPTTIDRVAEITAIFEDLERRRLQAILDQDEEAFRVLFANDEYLRESLRTMELVVVIDPMAAVLVDSEVFEDSDVCIGINATWDLTRAIEGGGVGTDDYILEPTPDGWGFSWVGRGWRCDRPHPLSR